MHQWHRELYDTEAVDPPDRYAYYRDRALNELAPVAVHGRPPGRLQAAMSVARTGAFGIETLTWAADSEIVARRTDRLIRICDPECYRLLLHVEGGPRLEQMGNQLSPRTGDIALYDLSVPWEARHSTGEPMRAVLLAFPKALLPIDPARIRPLLGRAMPRNLRGREDLARLLIELARTGMADPDLPEALYEGTVGLIRQRLGHSDAMSLRTRRLLQMALIQAVLRRGLKDPSLSPDQIAKTAKISPRYVHKICQDNGFKPMRMAKQLRLEECFRAVQDPAQAGMSIKEIAAENGYPRPDQFARDFRRQFGVSASRVRELAGLSAPRPGR